MAYIRNLMLVLLLSISFPVLSQQTGSYNHSITFDGQNRMVSLYVPEDYHPDTSYKVMIGLHGLGDNSSNYRNALINQLNWHDLFPRTVFVFPDSDGEDFYVDPGSEEVIMAALDYVRETYHTDSSHVVLQGFSLGGRSALKYGLDHPEKFKGLLLNTPAIQGMLDGQNDPESGLHYDYARASEIPIHASVGENDIIYHYILNRTTIPELKRNNGILSYTEVANMGHTVMGNSTWTGPHPYDFFADPAMEDYDIDLFELQTPHRTCDTDVPVTAYIQNRGQATVESIEIEYTTGAESGTYTWSGTLGLYEHTAITLPYLEAAEGYDEIQLQIGKVNQEHDAPQTGKTMLSTNLPVETAGLSLPVTQDFSDNREMWPVIENGFFSWDYDPSTSPDGTGSLISLNTILIFNSLGNVERFETPLLNLSSVPNPALIFQLAFNYHQYTPPVTQMPVEFADTLEVRISTDCGATFETIYRKGGADLATADEPIINALNIESAIFNPSSSEWRKEMIDLTDFQQFDQVLISFDYISDLGGSIYINEVIVEGSAGSEDMLSATTRIYPNPASDHLWIENPAVENSQIRIYDVAGRELLNQTLHLPENAQGHIDVSGLTSGTYFINVENDGESIHRQRIVVIK